MSDQDCTERKLWLDDDTIRKEAQARFYTRAICMLSYLIVSCILLIYIGVKHEKIQRKKLITI